MHDFEVDALPPDKLRGIIRLEARARPRFRSIQGLWGRGSRKRSGSITEYIRRRGLLPTAEIDRIIEQTPGELVAFQEAFRNGEAAPPFGTFLETQLIQIQNEVK